MATESASAIGHASSWGYACFLTVNATSVWGGIFPFLPLEFQTVEVTLTFFLTQAVAFGGAFLASMLGSYFFSLRCSAHARLAFRCPAIPWVGLSDYGHVRGIGCHCICGSWRGASRNRVRRHVHALAAVFCFPRCENRQFPPYCGHGYRSLHLPCPVFSAHCANGFSRPPDLRASVRSVRGTFGARDELRAAHVRGRPASAPGASTVKWWPTIGAVLYAWGRLLW